MLSTPTRESAALRWPRTRGNAPIGPQQTLRARPAAASAHNAASARNTATLAWPQGRHVHLWQLDLRDMGADATSLLDAAETERAQRFVYAHDWRRYVAAHAWLRRILGAYLGVPPQQLRFAAGAYGKPVLLQGPLAPGQAALCFNLSHSKDLALIAVTTGIEVGVDIEAVRDDLPGPDLAAGVLSAAELAELEQCAAPDHATSFVACWARKEACLKALGVGLGLEPRALNLGLRAERQAMRLDGAEALIDISPLPAPAGYCAALAAVGGFAQVELQDVAQHAAQRAEWRT